MLYLLRRESAPLISPHAVSHSLGQPSSVGCLSLGFVQTVIGWTPWRLRGHNRTFVAGLPNSSENWAKRNNERLQQPSCFKLSIVLSLRCKACSRRLPKAQCAFVRGSFRLYCASMESFFASLRRMD